MSASNYPNPSPSNPVPAPGRDRSSSPASGADGDHYRQLLDRLFSMLSHDLRTPLSAISGWLFLLESDKLDAAGKKRALDKIRSNLDEEVRLIDDTLLLVRYKAGTIRLDRVPVDLEAVLRAALEATQPAMSAKKVTLQNAVAAGSWFVDADQARVQRALELILDHALRSIPAGGGSVTISARPDPATSGDKIELAVTDSGRGIARSALPWLFDPFGQPLDPETGSRHPAERALLVAAALIEAHGGQLRADSAGEGSGSTFTVVLPRSKTTPGR